ncbi:MAG: hypothetical protein ACLP52_32720 [Streptosporangiaceae bacterium]
MTLLPVSGLALAVREPTGDDELYVVENSLAPVPAVAGLARRVAVTVTGRAVDWDSLPATDLHAAALVIRGCWLGPIIRTDYLCPDPGCRERADVSFSISDYLRHHRPRRARGVTQAAGPGWFTLAGATVRFRLPTVADLMAAVSGEHAADELSSRCVDAPELPAALARRLDRALSALAPSLDDLLGGSCPACGTDVTLRFDPLPYTLAELRNAFSGIYLETHALAAAYGWPEEAILALPRERRRRYASIIAAERAVR